MRLPVSAALMAELTDGKPERHRTITDYLAAVGYVYEPARDVWLPPEPTGTELPSD